MDSTTKIREAFVGWTVVGVEPYGREGGLRFTLTNGQSVTRFVGVFPGAQGGIHLNELKEGLTPQGGRAPHTGEVTWTDFRMMVSNLSMHSCPEAGQEINLVLSDEPMLRAVGFECKGCGTLWRISLTKLRSSDHPWTKAMREPEHRTLLMRHLEALGMETDLVPAEWRAFFRGEGPFPG
jgi:hypothetical protein